MSYAVEMLHINKRFPGVVANDDVSLQVKSGEIVGLIGENGAGKSTMMNMLYGMLPPDSGIIKIHGQNVNISSPHDAIQLGIGMVHQHFMLMPNLTVLMNIILGQEPIKRGFIDVKTAKAKIVGLMEEYDLQVNLDAKIYQLSVGEMQRVEIIKALYRGANILVLDEPTAVLTPVETDKLIDVLRKLKEQGCAIVFITHKLREVMAITDEVTVMRKGIVTGTRRTKDTNPKELSELMVGRQVDLNVPRKDYEPRSEILSMSNVSALNSRGLPALHNVNIHINGGEIVGIAGVEGNGQSELIRVISGMTPLTSGDVILHGRSINSLSVRERRDMGLSHIPEDRLKMGLAAQCTIRDNLILNRYHKKPYSFWGISNNRLLHDFSEKLCKAFSIKTPDSDCLVSSLSGGNMQKVVVARELENNPDLLIAAQPTRGVDIGAIEAIYEKIISVRDRGGAVLLVSAELDEILTLSDRIYVIYEGHILAELTRDEADERVIARFMTGSQMQEKMS